MVGTELDFQEVQPVDVAQLECNVCSRIYISNQIIGISKKVSKENDLSVRKMTTVTVQALQKLR